MERPLPRPSGYREAPTVAAARRPRVAFCLQAPSGDPNTAIATPVSEPKTSRKSTTPEAPSLPTGSQRVRTVRWWNVPARTRRNIAVGIVSVVATALLVGAWVVAVNHGPRTSMAAPAPKSRDIADITFPAPVVKPVPVAPVTLAANPSPAAVATVKPSIPSDRNALRTAARVALVQILVVR